MLYGLILLTIVAGVYYSSSAFTGEDNKSKALGYLKNAGIGIVIVLFAWVLPLTLFGLFGIKTNLDLTSFFDIKGTTVTIPGTGPTPVVVPPVALTPIKITTAGDLPRDLKCEVKIGPSPYSCKIKLDPAKKYVFDAGVNIKATVNGNTTDCNISNDSILDCGNVTLTSGKNDGDMETMTITVRNTTPVPTTVGGTNQIVYKTNPQPAVNPPPVAPTTPVTPPPSPITPPTPSTGVVGSTKGSCDNNGVLLNTSFKVCLGTLAFSDGANWDPTKGTIVADPTITAVGQIKIGNNLECNMSQGRNLCYITIDDNGKIDVRIFVSYSSAQVPATYSSASVQKSISSSPNFDNIEVQYNNGSHVKWSKSTTPVVSTPKKVSLADILPNTDCKQKPISTQQVTCTFPLKTGDTYTIAGLTPRISVLGTSVNCDLVNGPNGSQFLSATIPSSATSQVGSFDLCLDLDPNNCGDLGDIDFFALSSSPPPPQQAVQNVLNLVNQKRGPGHALVLDNSLNASAQAYAQRMADKQFFNHSDIYTDYPGDKHFYDVCDGLPSLLITNDPVSGNSHEPETEGICQFTPAEIAQDAASSYPYTFEARNIKAGYGNFTTMSENILWYGNYASPQTAADAVSDWINSPGHLRNLVCTRVDHTGIGVVNFINANGKNDSFWVQEFAGTTSGPPCT